MAFTNRPSLLIITKHAPNIKIPSRTPHTTTSTNSSIFYGYFILFKFSIMMAIASRKVKTNSGINTCARILQQFMFNFYRLLTNYYQICFLSQVLVGIQMLQLNQGVFVSVVDHIIGPQWAIRFQSTISEPRIGS